MLPYDQFHAGNVQNMLYISCCLTVSQFVTCPTPLFPHLHVLPFHSILSQTSQTLSNSSPLNLQRFRFWSNLLDGPYHLHMHPLGKPLPKQLSILLTHQPLFTCPNVFIAPCVTQYLNSKLVLYVDS